MKRFYKDASIKPVDDMFAVLLDGKQIKTPEKSACLIPTLPLAKRIAKEWDAQEDEIVPANMPLTKLMNTSIDRVKKRRDDLIDELVKYAGSDQLCYRAEHPVELIELQDKIWDPLLKWMSEENNVTLKLASGIIFLEQDSQEIENFRSILLKIDSIALTALHCMITVTGSVTVGYALFKGHISEEEAWEAGHLDENFQVSQWGIDEEAEERRKDLQQELKDAHLFLKLSRTN